MLFLFHIVLQSSLGCLRHIVIQASPMYHLRNFTCFLNTLFGQRQVLSVPTCILPPSWPTYCPLRRKLKPQVSSSLLPCGRWPDPKRKNEQSQQDTLRIQRTLAGLTVSPGPGIWSWEIQTSLRSFLSY